MKKEVRTVEHSDGNGAMENIRIASLLKALEVRNIDPFQGNKVLSGEDLVKLLEEAAAAGIRVPFKRYDDLSTGEKRTLDSQIEDAGDFIHPKEVRSNEGTLSVVDVHGKNYNQILEAVRLQRQNMKSNGK